MLALSNPAESSECTAREAADFSDSGPAARSIHDDLDARVDATRRAAVDALEAIGLGH